MQKPPSAADILRKSKQNNHHKGGSILKRSIFILGLTAGIIAAMTALSPRYRTETALPVTTVQVIAAPVRTSVTLRGAVAEQCRRALYPTGQSVVTEVYAAVGDTVEAGQPLLRLEPSADVPRLDLSEGEQLRELLLSGDTDSALSVLEAAMTSAGSIPRAPYTLTSPITGTVMSLAAEGERLSGLLPCGQVSDLSDLCIEAQAGESAVGSLAPGMECSIRVPALSSRTYRGSVGAVEPYASAGNLLSGDQSPTTRVRIDLRRKELDLKPGYSATVKVTTSTEPSGLWIPYEAVAQDDSGSEYALGIENGRAVRRDLTLGTEGSELVHVLSGLERGERVILSPEGIEEGRLVELALS